jgi:ABC-type Fe2+-enterobactin transport system substrate-binding protein
MGMKNVLSLGSSLLLLLVSLTGCNDDKTSKVHVTESIETRSFSSADSTWPRTLETPKGKLVLQKKPQRIVSTSVTLTGSLLTINAPVVASSSTVHMSQVTDKIGFFTQWSAIAQQRGVVPLYQGEVNAEAMLAMAPDLIVVSATGGDSALKAYEQLSQIAPTLVVNYDDKSWEEVSLILGQATGHEADAKAAIDEFNLHLVKVKQQITLPEQPVTAMVYYDDDTGANLWTKDSAQGRLLEKLGFTLAAMPDSLKNQSVALGRKDIIPVSGERFSEALTGHSLMLFAGDDITVKKVNANKFLLRHPAVAHNRVYAVGIDTFRLDYYSATNLLNRVTQLFS